jgi:hypothetical protein
MESTAIKAGTPSAIPNAPAPEPLPDLKIQSKSIAYRLLEFCASLRITVALFALSFFLVFYGTWAQKEQGVWTVVNEYFRTDVVWIRLRVLFFFLGDIDPNLAIPYPGGWLLGGLLLVNVLAAHAVRFQVSWKRSGILLIHAGIILMMLGELITGLFAIEGRMTIVEGYASNYLDHDRDAELAFVSRKDAKTDDEVIIPGYKLVAGKTITAPELPLPFDVEVVRYMANSEFVSPRGGDTNLATAGIGLKQVAVERAETVGVDPSQRNEFASAYVKLTRRDDGAALGTFLVSTYHTLLNFNPDQVEVGGKKYALYLRAKRSYRDYTIHLKQFDHKVYRGTKVPKDYRSHVRFSDPVHGEELDVQIHMNSPLRYRGETFYQASLHPLTKGTVLQVVRNPGWLLPYLSCIIVTLGLLIHFGIMLVRFIENRVIPAPVAAGVSRTPQALKPRSPRGGSHA